MLLFFFKDEQIRERETFVEIENMTVYQIKLPSCFSVVRHALNILWKYGII